MLYGIISYHRAGQQKTLEYLLLHGVKPEDIVLSLNDEADLPEYTRRYGKTVEIICKAKNNAAGNRNNILDHVGPGRQLVLLDDDVKGFVKWVPQGGKYGKMEKATFEEFQERMKDGFSVTGAFGARLFGFYPTENSMFICQTLQKEGQYSHNKLFQGGCVGITTSKDRFDERIPVCDDYDFILGQIAKGHGCVRINGFTAVKDKDFATKGGCYEAYQNGAQRRALLMICKKYPELVTMKKDGTGLRMKK